MDMKIINQFIELLGKDSALKYACGVFRPGPLDPEIDKSKIERAIQFEMIKPDTLELTDMGKIFVVKSVLDYADSYTDGYADDEDDELEKEDDDEENEDWDEDWDDEEDEDWDDEDEEFNDWENWEEDEDEDDDEEYGYKKRGKRR